ncbi:MAG TPA: LysR family transcriptional regulator, partial [Thermomicrobiales bacterium]|nr:LysR family transcriptional regulator [Thermomicrobiales bacterium]
MAYSLLYVHRIGTGLLHPLYGARRHPSNTWNLERPSAILIDMELIEIEAFVAIAASGTFTAAAERLHISQPAISRRIDLLEMELGAPLFERYRSG